MARSGADGAADGSADERPVRRRAAKEPAQLDHASTDISATPTRKRGRAPVSRRGKTGGNESDASSVEDKGSKRTRGKKKEEPAEEDNDVDEEALLASVSRETRKITSKRKRETGSILAEFTSLDALLSNDMEEKKRKAQRADKLRRLKEEVSGARKRGAVDAGASPLSKLMSEMEQSMTSLSADNDMFADELQTPRSHEEKFGFVFTPITEPLPYQPYKATPAELQGELQLVYKAMENTDEEELSALLWSKAILLGALLNSRQASSQAKSTASSSALVQPVVLPPRISSWMFLTMSTHSNSHIVKGCLSNLFSLLSGTSHQLASELKSGLDCASFCHSVQDFRAAIGDALPDLQMEWRPTVYDFLNAFRRFGFQDSKRSMSARSKISITKSKGSSTSSGQQPNAKGALPFPTLNMQYVLVFLVLCLRTKLLRLDGYDAFSFTMFFLRMQFEHNMHPQIVQLASICIEELLEVFPTAEWRKEWGSSLVLRIAGASEGLFDSASGWLTVARRLPRTNRGTQLTTGLAVYVLQHRIDKSPDDANKSERPLKFPIQSGLVLDIVAGIVEDLTAKYTEKKKTKKKDEKTPPPPFDLLCKKVALMDLALQAFLNELTQKEMSIMLKKLDDLTSSHKSTMSAKWHELKTLVSLMHRKYSLENLRVGRRDNSPRAKAVLFLDDDIKDEVKQGA